MIAGAAVGAGANVAGGLMQSIAASLANREMNDVFAREIQRQQRHRNEAFGTFQPAVQLRGVETARDQIGQGAEKREGFYGKVGESQFSPGGDPRTGQDKTQANLLAKQRAQLGGYSDWALNQMISNIRTQDELNRLSSFSAGDAQVFPYDMYEAQHSQDELAFWGQLIASLGSGAGSFINSGGPPQGGGQPLAFGGQGSPANAGFGVPEGFAGQFAGYA